jgi:hypothetical protein
VANVRRSADRHRDLPFMHYYDLAAIGAGSASDPAQEKIVAGLADLRSSFPPFLAAGIAAGSGGLTPVGPMGGMADNSMSLRQVGIMNAGAANTTGDATNNCDFRLNLWRNGVLQGCLAYYPLSVNTTIGTAVVSADIGLRKTVTPASMTGIVPGLVVRVDTSTNLEVVTVLSTTATTFDAVFTKTHITSAAVVTELRQNQMIPWVLPAGVNTTAPSTIAAGVRTPTPASMYGIRVGDTLLIDTVASGVQERVVVTSVTNTTFTATFANAHTGPYAIVSSAPVTGNNVSGYNSPFEIKGGDVLTLTRISNNATGLATLVGRVYFEWVNSRILQ